MEKINEIINIIKKIPCINLICILVIIPFLRIIPSFTLDNDFYFTINQGRYVLEHGFPTIAINSIHELDFIYQSWGSGTLFYLIYHYLGNYGLVILLISVMELTSFFFYKLCYTISNKKRLSLGISIITMLLYNYYYFTTRPHIFTVLNLVIILYLIEKYLKTLKKKYLYFVPVIFLFQVNMHGIYFIVILIFLLPYVINAFNYKIGKFISDGYHKKTFFIILIISFLVGFINPYTYKTVIYGFLSYNSSSVMNNMILELLAPNFHKLMGKVVIVLIIIIYILYFSSKKKIPIRYYLLLFGSSYLAFDAIKSFNYFLILSMFPLSYILAKNNKNEERKYSLRYYLTQITIFLSITIVICLNITFAEEPNTKKFADYLDETKEEKDKIKLYTGFNEGSYLEWRGYYCYIDPRAEIFLKSNNHKEDIMDEYNKVQNYEINYEEFLHKYDFDYLLLEKKRDALYHQLKLKPLNYKNVLEDEIYVLYQKQ